MMVIQQLNQRFIIAFRCHDINIFLVLSYLFSIGHIITNANGAVVDLANRQQSYPTSCNQVFDESGFFLAPASLALQHHESQHYCYNVVYRTEKPMAWGLETCYMNETHKLQLQFQQHISTSNIFYIYIEDAFISKFLIVRLLSRETFYECKPTKNATIVTLSNNRRFTNFSCPINYNKEMTDAFVHAIDITSRIIRWVNLTKHQQDGKGILLDWLILQIGHAPSSAFINVDETMMINDGSRISDYYPRYVLGPERLTTSEATCPPVIPYVGMPKKYRNYLHVKDGSINQLLLTSPCKGGYKLVGNLNQVNQCKNGTWLGSGFPKCEVIMPKTPPDVGHAKSKYVHEDVYHEIFYTCDDGYYITGSGKATYICSALECDAAGGEWIDVPQCQTAVERFMRNCWPLLIFISIVSSAFVVAIIFQASKIRKLKLGATNNNNGKASSTITTAKKNNHCDDDGYVLPLIKGSDGKVHHGSTRFEEGHTYEYIRYS